MNSHIKAVEKDEGLSISVHGRAEELLFLYSEITTVLHKEFVKSGLSERQSSKLLEGSCVIGLEDQDE